MPISTRLGSGVEVRCTDGARIVIGRRCSIGRGTTIVAQGGALHIGDDVVVGHWCTVTSKERVNIGSDCLIAERVTIRDQNHAIWNNDNKPIRLAGFETSPVDIGKDVWIGAGAAVLMGVTIGDGAVVGANAVVVRDVGALSVVGGVPARVIGDRESNP